MAYSPVLVTYPYERYFTGPNEPHMRERWRIRNATLQLLADLGIHPTVHTSEAPASHIHNRWNAVKAIRSTTGPVLFLEDDLIPTRALLDWLDACADQEHVVILCSIRIGDLPEWVGTKVRKLEPISPQFVPLGRAHWSGAQALYIPERIADRIRTDDDALKPASALGPFDTYLRRTFRRAIAAVPSPVQHRSPLSLVRKRTERVAETFAHPTTKEIS